ncbi:unnamed protein product [Ceratitis capitata]|uniref:(Mediterranean fruit fly) hypothetical protein n=1 Tax=Ceratitis capitata TaxID=7213 RepID=A0A811V7Y0_CERCA|nr:unnamed protein product [Ceratitis capitata]
MERRKHEVTQESILLLTVGDKQEDRQPNCKEPHSAFFMCRSVLQDSQRQYRQVRPAAQPKAQTETKHPSKPDYNDNNARKIKLKTLNAMPNLTIDVEVNTGYGFQVEVKPRISYDDYIK